MVSISLPILAIQIANFLVLIFVLNMVLYKPIRKILTERKEKLQGLEKSASACDAQAEEKNQAFIAGIREARAKGQKEKEALMQAAMEEENTVVTRINDQAKEDLAKIKAKITNETAAVRKELEKEVDAFADAITQKILGRAA
ncbi:MAG: ATPase [Desulfatitalea sp.]|nr:ATPase [Desulfatitalea sp.]NNK01069.1 ATPase [Desulfatitalea sp.]